MNAKTTMILAFVFMGLAGVAALDSFVWKEARRAKSESESLVFSLRDDTITSLTIRSGGKNVKLNCVKSSGCPFDFNGEWRVVEPIQDDGDSSNIGSLLTSLKNLTPVGRVEADPSSLVEFGLEKPEATLDVQLTDGKELRLAFGGESAIGANRYLRTNTNDSEVYLVAAFFPAQLGNEVFHWRNKRILRGVETESVERLQWNAGQSMDFKRDGQEWMFASPFRAPANKIAVEGVLNTVLYANGKKLVSESGVVPAGAKRTLAVNIWLKDGKRTQVEIFSTSGKDSLMRVAGAKMIYAVDGVPFERFKRKADEFRFRRLISFDKKNAATEITLKFPREKQEVLLRKKDGDWERAGGAELKETLSQTRIKDFFDSLAGHDAESFTRDGAKWKKFQNPADLEVVIGKQVLRFVLDGKDSVLANGELSGEARIMTGDFLRTLPVRLSDLYESTNKRIVVKEPEKDEHHDHNH